MNDITNFQNAFEKGTYTIKHISNYMTPYIYKYTFSKSPAALDRRPLLPSIFVFK